MRKLFFAALAAFFMSAVPAFAQDAACQYPLDKIVISLQMFVAEHGGKMTALNHDETQKFLDILNHTPPETTAKADMVLIGQIPGYATSLIMFVNGDCVFDKTEVPADVVERILSQVPHSHS